MVPLASTFAHALAHQASGPAGSIRGEDPTQVPHCGCFPPYFTVPFLCLHPVRHTTTCHRVTTSYGVQFRGLLWPRSDGLGPPCGPAVREAVPSRSCECRCDVPHNDETASGRNSQNIPRSQSHCPYSGEQGED